MIMASFKSRKNSNNKNSFNFIIVASLLLLFLITVVSKFFSSTSDSSSSRQQYTMSDIMQISVNNNNDNNDNDYKNEDPMIELEKCKNTLVTRPEQNKYGAWTYCESILRNKKNNPIIISFGIGTNMDWEKYLITEYNSIVYGHDPTPKSVQFVQKEKDKYDYLNNKQKFIFTDVGIGINDDNNVTMNLPSNPNYVSGRVGSKEENSIGSVQIKLLSLQSTFQLHKLHTPVDIIKWDVEGIEFDIINHLFTTNHNNKFGIPTKLFLLEWHTRFNKDIDPKCQEKATKLLTDAGFIKIHTSTNKEEEVFFNTRYNTISSI